MTLSFQKFIRITTFLFVLSCTTAEQMVRPRHCGGAVHHVHLAVGADPSTSMTVSFASIPSYYKPVPVGAVAIGFEPDRFHMIFVEEEPPRSYNVTIDSKLQANGPPLPPDDEENGIPRYWSPYYHHVTITGLQPDTLYYYQPIVAGSKKDLKHTKPYLRNPTGSIILHDSPMETQWDLDNHNHSTNDVMRTNTTEPDVYVNDDEGEDIEDQQVRRRLALIPYDGSARDCPAMDKVRSFSTAAASTSASPGGSNVNHQRTTRFAIVGDLGQFPHSQETLQHLYQSTTAFDAMILAGDIAYTDGDGRRWDTFFDFWDDTPLAERIPIMVCPGNHDIDKVASGKDIFLAYEHRFRMPRIKPAELGQYEGPKGPLNMDQPPYPLPYEYGNAYYSFPYQSAQIFMLSPYSAMEPGSKQYEWLKDGLGKVDRQVTPWLIIVIHTPLYSTFALHRHDPQIFAAIEHLEPLFVQYEVNFVFSGHIHAYLRTKAVRFRKLHPKGPMHFTVGAGGRKCEAPFLNSTAEDFVAVRDATKFGYGLLQIFNATTASWDWIHTGHNEDRDYNQLWKSEQPLPPGPGSDRVILQNQYFL